MKLRVAVLLILAVALASAQAQTTKKPRKPAPPAAPANYDPDAFPIESIAIAGIHNYSKDQVLAIAKLRAGQAATKADLEAAHERLMASGVFDSVAYRYDPSRSGVAVVFTVVETNTFYPMMFEDFPADDAKIRAWLHEHDPLFGPKIPATKESLAHYSQLIGEYLATLNFTDPVSAKLSAENPPDLVILFRPAGQRPVIAQVTAENTGQIVAGVVQSTLYGVAVGTIYSEARVRQLLDSSVRPLYEAKGRLRVTFPKITAEPAKDVKGMAVTISVEQGPEFEFAKVRFAGVDTDADELRDLVKIKTETLADFDKVRAAERALVDKYKHDGFLRAQCETIRDVHDDTKTVDLTFKVETGPLFTFRNLTIVGLDIISEPVLRKLWGLESGKPFNPEYPDHFLRRVKEDGYFDNLKTTTAERTIDQQAHTVDVVLTFKSR